MDYATLENQHKGWNVTRATHDRTDPTFASSHSRMVPFNKRLASKPHSLLCKRIASVSTSIYFRTARFPKLGRCRRSFSASVPFLRSWSKVWSAASAAA